MRIEHIRWTTDCIDHIARHHCSPDEVEEVFNDHPLVLRTHSGRYLALGRTFEGRCLTVVFSCLRSRRQIRIITARDMDNKERRYYRQKRT